MILNADESQELN